VEKLKTTFQSEFLIAPALTWVEEGSNRLVGTVRSANGGRYTAGNVTFVTLFDSGYVLTNFGYLC